MHRWSAAALAASVSVAVLAHPALAQTTGRDSAAQTAPQVSEVVVTALKRQQKLIDAPVPVTALAPQTLQQIAAISFNDYLARVPGFQDISLREGETQLILRGISTGESPNATVGTYVDDSPFGSSSVYAAGGVLTPDFDPSDLQRVEVLRGPQGTLYGASTLGGLIKFVTIPPDPTGYHARVEVDGDTVDHGGSGYGARVMLNAPIVTDKLAFRISAFDREDPGFIDDPNLGRQNVNDTRVNGGRASVLWNADSALTVRLTAMLQNLKSYGTPDVDVSYPTLEPIYGPYQQVRYEPELLYNKYQLYNADIHWDLGFASLVSSTSYSNLHTDTNADVTAALGALLEGALGIPNLGVDEPTPIRLSRFTEELRLASNPGHRLDWLVGAYFNHERTGQTQAFNAFDALTGAPIDLPFVLAQTSLDSRFTEYAGFADATYHFTSKFDILAGVRVSNNLQHYTQCEGGALAGGAFTCLSPAKSQAVSTTFLVTPEYKFSPDNMVYLRIASGFRPGGPNALAPGAPADVPTSFKPDSLVNYEVGYKAALLDQRLTLDLSAFYIDWTDVQLETLVGDFTVEGNGGAARSDGFEGTLTFTPVRGLTFSDNLAYTDARLTVDAPVTGAFSGDRLPYVPTWSENFNVDYDWTPISGWHAYVGASWRYVSDRYSGFVSGAPAGYTRPVLPAYSTFDLRTGVTHGAYSLNLYVKNIGDSRGLTNIGSQALDGYDNPYTAGIIQPRTFGMALSAQF